MEARTLDGRRGMADRRRGFAIHGGVYDSDRQLTPDPLTRMHAGYREAVAAVLGRAEVCQVARPRTPQCFT